MNRFTTLLTLATLSAAVGCTADDDLVLMDSDATHLAGSFRAPSGDTLRFDARIGDGQYAATVTDTAGVLIRADGAAVTIGEVDLAAVVAGDPASHAALDELARSTAGQDLLALGDALAGLGDGAPVAERLAWLFGVLSDPAYCATGLTGGCGDKYKEQYEGSWDDIDGCHSFGTFVVCGNCAFN